MSKTALRAAALLTAATALAPLGAGAEDFSKPFGECRTGYWSGTRNLDNVNDIAKASCFVSWKQAIGAQTRVSVNGRAGVRDQGDADGAGGRLREAYVEHDAGPWRLRLGRQIIAWGRADRINPTDSLSPRDYTALVPEDEEQRMGIDAAAATFRIDDSLDVQAVVVPRFTPNVLPQGLLPPNRSLQDKPEGAEWALKMQKSGGSWDGSLSYYHGYDRFPRYGVQFLSPASVRFVGAFDRMQTIGADFAGNAGSFGLRGEFAASRIESRCQNCPQSKRRVQRLVLGIDRDVGESANINMQLFAIHRSGYSDPSALPPLPRMLGQALDRLNSEFGTHEAGVSLRMFDRYLNDRLKTELGVIIDTTNGSGLLRPRVSYSISDVLKVTGGVDYLYGDTQSFFGARERNRLGFIELTFVF